MNYFNGRWCELLLHIFFLKFALILVLKFKTFEILEQNGENSDSTFTKYLKVINNFY